MVLGLVLWVARVMRWETINLVVDLVISVELVANELFKIEILQCKRCNQGKVVTFIPNQEPVSPISNPLSIRACNNGVTGISVPTQYTGWCCLLMENGGPTRNKSLDLGATFLVDDSNISFC